MLLIDRTYEVFMPHGEADAAGLDAEGVEVSFRELVSILRGGECSWYPIPHDTACDAADVPWVTHYGSQDSRDGSYRNESIHFSRRNPSRKARYWIKALRVAGYR